MTSGTKYLQFPHRHLLGIHGLSQQDIIALPDRADHYVALNRQQNKKGDALRGRTQINLFFESSTRTQSSFELAGKRLGADVMNMSVASSAMNKGETLIDTAVTLNAMNPDLIVVRHASSCAVALLAQKVTCAVLNAGDGAHEHPTQALLDIYTLRRSFEDQGGLNGKVIMLAGDLLRGLTVRSLAQLLTHFEGVKIILSSPEKFKMRNDIIEIIKRHRK